MSLGLSLALSLAFMVAFSLTFSLAFSFGLVVPADIRCPALWGLGRGVAAARHAVLSPLLLPGPRALFSLVLSLVIECVLLL